MVETAITCYIVLIILYLYNTIKTILQNLVKLIRKKSSKPLQEKNQGISETFIMVSSTKCTNSV